MRWRAVLCACVQSLIITPAVALVYPDVDAMLFAATVVGNSSLFAIFLAVPGIVYIQDELGFVPWKGRRRRALEG
ncbi:MAG: hypothetical protein ACOYIP_00035 [Coriobacteriales bacterium]